MFMAYHHKSGICIMCPCINNSRGKDGYCHLNDFLDTSLEEAINGAMA